MHVAIQSIHTLEGCNAPPAPAAASFHNRRRRRRAIPVWLVPLILVAILLSWYRVLNGSTNWASWITFLVLDFSVTFLGIVLLLVLRPMSTIIIPPKQQQQPTTGTTTTNTEQPSSIVRDEEVPLTTTTTGEDQQHQHTAMMISGDTTTSDIAITIHMTIFLVGWSSSCISDDVATYMQSDMSLPYFLAFLVFDMIENFIYVAAFGLLAICYRTIAIQLWNIQSTIEHVLEDSIITSTTHEDNSHDNTMSSSLASREENPNLQIVLSESLSTYETMFEITETLSGKTGYVTVLLIALATMEMASTLHDVFTEQEGESIDWTDINHLAIFRLLVVIASLILQVGLAAADLMYASERLAEALARVESSLRIQQVGSSNSNNENKSKNSIQEYAQVCRAFGDRVRNHPARIRLSWFHLTTEWAMGVVLVVFALLLAVFDIELPGGE